MRKKNEQNKILGGGVGMERVWIEVKGNNTIFFSAIFVCLCVCEREWEGGR